jgi:hypothetical protein
VVRNPNVTVQVNLRIKESLRRKLEREADKHQTSLNNEMRLRLEDSFEATAERDLVGTAARLERACDQLEEHFLRQVLADNLIAAMAKSADPEVAKAAQIINLTGISMTERGLRRRRERDERERREREDRS